MELFDINVKATDEAQYDYSYSGVGFSDFGAKEVSTFKFGVLRSEEKNGIYVKFSPIKMDSNDYVLDCVKIVAGTEELDGKLYNFLTEISKAIMNADEYSDVTGILPSLVGLIVPTIIDPETRTISFPLNIQITTTSLEKFFGDKWIGIEWSGDKEFTAVMKELLVPAIQIFGEMICPEICSEEDADNLLTTFEMIDNNFKNSYETEDQS